MREHKRGILDILEAVLGVAIDILPILCAVMIVVWAGRAYTEGHRLFVPEGMDPVGEAHSEMVTITEEDADSILAVGRVLEKENLIDSGLFFAVKAKLSGMDDMICPGVYVLSSDMNAEQILERITVDPAVDLNSLENSENPDAEETESSGSGKENRDVWGQ